MSNEDNDEFEDSDFESDDEDEWHWFDEEPKCPFCGVGRLECAHLVAELDRKNGSYVGGYLCSRSNLFHDIAMEVFETWLSNGNKPEVSWSYFGPNEIEALWDEARQRWHQTGKLYGLDSVILSRIEIQVLGSAGAKECNWFSDGGFPSDGFPMTSIYAEEPAKVVADAVLVFQRLLGLTDASR